MDVSPNSNGQQSLLVRPWLFASFSGYAGRDLSRDIIAGLILTAIAIPEQMATARLAGLPPQLGFIAFAAGAVAFAVFGASRYLSVGADSTIAPILAGGLVLWAVGTPEYAGMAAAVAIMVGIILTISGLLRLGWVANILSVPVTTGFLAGISVHIAVSQLPGLLGIVPPPGTLPAMVADIVAQLPRSNFFTMALGVAVLGLMLVAERLSPRIPGALAGLVIATVSVVAFGLERRGVAVLGDLPGELPHFAVPAVTLDGLLHVVPLALIIALLVMLQTGATTRSFASGVEPALNRDFIGAGAANLLAGFLGAFPVNASPPRTAIVVESGGRSQLAGLVAACLVLGLAAFWEGFLAHVPQAALAGVLLFIAFRIFRLRVMAEVFRRSPAEFTLIVVTMAAIVVLPIEAGVGTGIVLSLMHGMWTTTRAYPIALQKVPGTSVWWTTSPRLHGETQAGVVVVAFQAPLSFLNAYSFKQGMLDMIDHAPTPPHLVVLEASNISAIDFTAAEILEEVIHHCQSRTVTLAVARLESVRAQEAFVKFGLIKLIGEDHVFHSVDEAIRALAGSS